MFFNLFKTKDEAERINPYQAPRQNAAMHEGEPVDPQFLPVQYQCCGTCKHWQRGMGIATVRLCNYPLPDWVKRSERPNTYYKDGQFCHCYEQRDFKDYLDYWIEEDSTLKIKERDV